MRSEGRDVSAGALRSGQCADQGDLSVAADGQGREEPQDRINRVGAERRCWEPDAGCQIVGMDDHLDQSGH